MRVSLQSIGARTSRWTVLDKHLTGHCTHCGLRERITKKSRVLPPARGKPRALRAPSSDGNEFRCHRWVQDFDELMMAGAELRAASSKPQPRGLEPRIDSQGTCDGYALSRQQQALMPCNEATAPPSVSRAVGAAFLKFDGSSKGYLTRHEFRCAHIALLGNPPSLVIQRNKEFSHPNVLLLLLTRSPASLSRARAVHRSSSTRSSQGSA